MTIRRFPLGIPLVWGLAAMTVGSVAGAPTAWSDPQALSPFVPVQVEDAFPVPYGNIELQGDAHYTYDVHGGGGGNDLLAEPVIKLGGPIHGMQFSAATPHHFGDASDDGSGGVTGGLFYNFNQNTRWVPAFAVDASYEIPDGAGYHTGETTLRGIATKYLGDDEKAPRLHLNVSWYHLTDPSPVQQEDQFEVGIAYSTLVSDSTAFVTDYVHGDKTELNQDQNFIDAGLRHEITDTLAVSGGAGFGFADQSPGFRLMVALQKEFKAF